nr:MAG TPA: Ig-like domain protein [Caudoviricetes sp.]
MAIKTVRAKVNGTWHNLTYNSSTKKWEASITAPGVTSYNLPGGCYDIEVEATNDAGTTGTASAATLDGLKLVVREKVAPVITILSPSSGAYVTNSKQPVVFTVIDETGGSGVDLDTLAVKQDGVSAAASTLAKTAVTGGYSVTYTPAAALSDGSHTVTIDVSDHDGNAAAQKTTSYTVDTVPPTLNVTAPEAGLITNSASLTVRGTTNDATSSPVTVRVSLNGVDKGTATVSADGSFTKALTLANGSNTIVVTATDAAGKSSSVTRTVTLDTSVPVIQSAAVTPNPVDAGATMLISVVIA